MRTMTFIDEVNLKFEDDKTYSRDDIMSIILHTLAELSDSDAVRNYALAIAEKYKMKLDNQLLIQVLYLIELLILLK